MKLLPDHAKVLAFLAENSSEDACFPFAPISDETGLDRKRVKFICRSLRRKGLAEFYRGLWTDEGEPGGAGYCVTRAGRTLAAESSP